MIERKNSAYSMLLFLIACTTTQPLIEEAKANSMDALRFLIEASLEDAEKDLQGKNIIREMIPINAI